MCDKIIHSFGTYNPLDINNTYDPYTKKGIKYMSSKAYEYLQEEAKDIELEAFLCLQKINADNIIFDCLFDQLMKYLEKNPKLFVEKGEK